MYLLLVFSSSATVYDEANLSPLNEDMPTGMPNNNYGYTKLIVEQMLQKLAQADNTMVDCFTSLF